VLINFDLKDKRRVDLDNLSKAILDACNGIVWVDDKQIIDLHLTKRTGQEKPGVTVTVLRKEE
jgi:Holliday junction resolvase RusA-like endonuclease